MDDLPGLTETTTESIDKSAGDCILRQYRIAISATPQYSNYHGAFSTIQSGLVQSAIVTTINRINQIYSHDLSIRLQLIANNDVLYLYEEATTWMTLTWATSIHRALIMAGRSPGRVVWMRLNPEESPAGLNPSEIPLP